MKKDFFAFIKPADSEINEVWNSCVFSIDANILLNFYRYTTDTTNTFFNLLEKLQERIHLTHQACEEFFDNRLEVISEQEKTYLEVISSLQRNVIEPLQHERKHPYVNADLFTEFKAVSEQLIRDLETRGRDYSQKIYRDELLDRIINILDEKVGKPYSEERLSELYQLGDKRYNEKIPPGFKDSIKGGIRQYGDLVLWFQMIDIAKELDKDLIFITDDEKEDWLQIHKGKTIGPLPQLQKEFSELTGRRIYLYNAPNFIKKAGELFNTVVAEETIAEVKNLSEENKLTVEANLDTNFEENIEDKIDDYIVNAIHAVENETGWAELAPLGLYLNKNTPVNYRNYGFATLRRFIESRGKFELKVLRKSPNAKNVDTAYVRVKDLVVKESDSLTFKENHALI